NRDYDQQLDQRKAAALASSLKRKHGCTLSVRRQGAAVGRIVNPSRTVWKSPTVDSLTVTYFVAQLAHVPNFHGLIPASRDQPTVGAERHAADEADVAAEVPD